MSNTRKTPAARAAEKIEVKGIQFAIYDDKMVATLSSRKKVELSLLLDLEQLFLLMEGVGAIDDDGDVITTLAALRKLMPEDFLTAVKGVDAAVSLTIFMQWATVLGERLGKALT